MEAASYIRSSVSLVAANKHRQQLGVNSLILPRNTFPLPLRRFHITSVQFVWQRNVATHQPAWVNLAKPVENGRSGKETLFPSEPSVTMTAENDMNTRAMDSGSWCIDDNDTDFQRPELNRCCRQCCMLRSRFVGNSVITELVRMIDKKKVPTQPTTTQMQWGQCFCDARVA